MVAGVGQPEALGVGVVGGSEGGLPGFKVVWPPPLIAAAGRELLINSPAGGCAAWAGRGGGGVVRRTGGRAQVVEHGWSSTGGRARVVEHGWSRAVLTHHIATNRRGRVGEAPNNFPTTLAAAESDLPRFSTLPGADRSRKNGRADTPIERSNCHRKRTACGALRRALAVRAGVDQAVPRGIAMRRQLSALEAVLRWSLDVQRGRGLL